jgi:uncharacterized protein YxeA
MLLSRHLPERVSVLRKSLILGLFLTVLLIFTAACGKETFNEISTNDLKEFISDKQTGFILYTDDQDHAEVNTKQVAKALESNGKESKHFNYAEEVTNEESATFRSDIGSQQTKDSLGYYEDGILLAEFELQDEWTPENIENLNNFIQQISE